MFSKRIIAVCIIAITLTLAACTPGQVQSFFAARGQSIDRPTAAAVAANLTEWERQQRILYAYLAAVAANDYHNRHPLPSIRACESGGNYGAVSSSGTYRGAYQFNQGTWNGVASRHRSRLVGVDPAGASVADQDYMAWMLYTERGTQPWPVCGR